MGEARAEITIDRPADDVWAVIGNFGDLMWMPGIESCELDGDDRILGMFGMRIVERQLARDEEGRSLTYGIVDGDMKPEVHRATITVMPAGSGSFVTWDVETDDAMVEVMQGAYTGALGALKEQLES
jgi:carbon monoxide dehydrogenase subunit G